MTVKRILFLFSEHEKITLYQKHLKLESSTRACKIKVSHSILITFEGSGGTLQ